MANPLSPSYGEESPFAGEQSPFGAASFEYDAPIPGADISIVPATPPQLTQPTQAQRPLGYGEYVLTRSGEDEVKVYAEYVGKVLPDYFAAIGLTPQQQKVELDAFRKLAPSPLYKVEERTAAEFISDTNEKAARGMASGGLLFTDLFGADNPASRWLRGQQKKAEDNLSKSAKTDEKNKQIERDNLANPTALDRIGLTLKQMTTDPVGEIAEFTFQLIPMLSATVATGGVAGVTGVGAAVGAGAIKGGIYETFKSAREGELLADPLYKQLRDSGVGQEEARERLAVKYQSYVQSYGKIATGAAMGAVVSRFGVLENMAGGVAKQIAAREATAAAAEAPRSAIRQTLNSFGAGAAKEAITEIPQEYFETVSGNRGAASGGAKIDPYQGALEAATRAGVLASLSGGAGNVVQRAGQSITPTQLQAVAPATLENEAVQTPAPTAQVTTQREDQTLNEFLDRVSNDATTATASDTQDQTQGVENVRNENTVRSQQVQANQSGQDASNAGQESQQAQANQSGQDASNAVDGRQVQEVSPQTAQWGQEEVGDLPKLPKDLAGAKPRFAYQDKNYKLDFTNDVDRALYIVGRSKKLSNAANDYMTWLQSEVYPNETESQIRGRGQVVAQAIRTTASSAPASSKVLTVPQYFKSSRSQPTVVSDGGEAAPAKRVAPTKNIPAIQTADTTQAGAQVLEDLQVPDDPQLTAEVAEEMITRLSDAVEQSDNPSQAAAFVAAETESPTTGPIETSQASTSAGGKRVRRSGRDQSTAPTKKRIGKSSPAVNIEGVDSGAEAVRTSEPGQSSGRALDTSGSQNSDNESVAQTRDKLLGLPDELVAASDRELERLSGDLQLLGTAEAKELSEYLYIQFDVGMGAAQVSLPKLARARALTTDFFKSKRLRNTGLDRSLLQDLADVYDNQDVPVIREFMEEQALPRPVMQALREGKLNEALQLLYLTGSTPVVRALAGRLSDVYLGNVDIQFKNQPKITVNGVEHQVGGMWRSKLLRIELDPTYGTNEHTLLHEVTHAVTLEKLRNPISETEKSAVREMNSLFTRAQRILPRGEYAFTNLGEFVAEAFSNPEFQMRLWSVKLPDTGKSIWRTFVDTVLRLVGLDNLLGRTINVAETLISTPGSFTTEDMASVVGKPTVVVKRTNDKYTALLDAEAAVFNLGKQVNKQINLPDSQNLAIQNSQKRSYSEEKMRQLEELHIDPFIEKFNIVVAQQGVSAKELQEIIVQHQVLGRAAEKAKQLALGSTLETDPDMAKYLEEKGIKAEEARASADKFLTELETTKPVLHREVIKLLERIRGWQEFVHDSRLTAKNNMSPARKAALMGAFKTKYMPGGFYLPLQLDSGDGSVSVIRTSTGTNFRADDPIARMYAQAAITFKTNEANREKQIIFSMAQKLNLIDEKTNRPLIVLEPVAKLVIDKNTGAIISGKENLILDDRSVGVWINSGFFRMKFTDPAIAEALKGHMDNNQVLGAALQAVSTFTRLMSMTRTVLNPAFAPFDAVRNITSTAVVLDETIPYSTYAAALPYAFGKAFKNSFSEAFTDKVDAKWAQARADGVFTSHATYLGLDTTVADINQRIDPTIAGRAKAVVMRPLDTRIGRILAAWTQAFDSANRYAIYDAAITTGQTPKQAAYYAKNNGTNFERRSKFIDLASPWFMFVKPATQGKKLFIDKTIGVDANRRTQGAIGALFVMGVITAAMAYSEEDRDKDGLHKYGKVPDYKRDRLLLAKAGAVGIPLPQETGLAYVLGNAIGDVQFGDATIGQASGRFIKALIALAAPVGTGQGDLTGTDKQTANYLLRLFTPTLATPIVDFAVNKDTFGRDITPKGQQFSNKPMSQRFTVPFKEQNPETVALAKELYGFGVDISPPQLKHLQSFFSGGVDKFWQDMLVDREPRYAGEVVNPMAKRWVGNAVNFDDKRNLFETFQSLKDSKENATASQVDIELLTQFEALKGRNDQLFRGYNKMTPEERKRRGTIADERSAELMRKYYVAKGIVKE